MDDYQTHCNPLNKMTPKALKLTYKTQQRKKNTLQGRYLVKVVGMDGLEPSLSRF